MSDLTSLHDRINRLFENSYYGNNEREADAVANWYPPTDIIETKDNYILKLEVPGMKKEDVNIELKANVLTIKGERKEEKEIKEENYHRIESFSGAFSRSFTMPDNIDSQNVFASMKDGVLELKIAKAEDKKSKCIAIE